MSDVVHIEDFDAVCCLCVHVCVCARANRMIGCQATWGVAWSCTRVREGTRRMTFLSSSCAIRNLLRNADGMSVVVYFKWDSVPSAVLENEAQSRGLVACKRSVSPQLIATLI